MRDLYAALEGSITMVYAVDPAVYAERESDPFAGLTDADRRLVVEHLDG